MSDSKELWKEINQLREKLRIVVHKKGMNSPEAIRASMAFRNKMKEYNDLIAKSH